MVIVVPPRIRSRAHTRSEYAWPDLPFRPFHMTRKKTTFLLKRFIPPWMRGVGLCAAAGAICSLLHTPLPWMIGPLLAMAAAKLFGVDVGAPKNGRESGQLLIGCTLGLYFTPVVMGLLWSHALLMLLAAVLAIVLGYICAFFLARVSGIDKTTALFASMPGGATEMAVLGEHHGARIDKVAFAQSLRILLVVVIVPSVLTLSGAHGADQFQAAPGSVSYSGLALLLSLCAAGGWVLSKLKVPNAWMLGPLFVSIVVTGTEVGLSAMPKGLSNLGQLLLGCALGSRFEQNFMRSARRFVFGVTASITLAIVLSAVFAVVLAWLGGIPLPTMILAIAPGGIGEMGITAKVLQLGVPLVTAFHVTRIVLLVTTTAPLVNGTQRMAARFKSRRLRKK